MFGRLRQRFGQYRQPDSARGRHRFRLIGCFESLEVRDLLSAIRLVSWNTLNQPTNATQDADFRTVLNAIGQEAVLGTSKPLDILALAETDTSAIARLESVLDNLYGTTAFEFANSSVVSGDATGFVYDNRTVSLVETVNITSGLTHPSLRGRFRPAMTFGESDFYVYAVHLKAGNLSSDVATRGQEATLLRANADAIGDGANVIFAGDFNILGSSEPTWNNLMATGAGAVSDTANTPGEWANNNAFKTLHSQNSQSNLRSRLDFHFISGELNDGAGYDYVDGSFHVFGNNGSHALGGSITTGSGASTTVLNALVGASDHLPVVSDFNVVNSTPLVQVTQSGGTTSVVEGGAYDTFTVYLGGRPTSNVSVLLSVNSQLDLGAGAGKALALQFTPQNAGKPQTVNVRAVDDLSLEGNHSASVVTAVTSLDTRFDGLLVSPIVVSIIDNDAPALVINELDSQTPGSGTDLAEFVELYDGGVGNVSLAGYTVVFYNGANDQSYYALDLDSFSTDNDGFFVLGNAGVAGVDATFANSFLQNGADAVALYLADASSFPNGTAVRLTGLVDALVYDNGSADDAGLLPLLLTGQPQVNENQNSNADDVSLSRIPDGGSGRQTATYVPRTPTPGARNAQVAGGVSVLRNIDGVTVREGGLGDNYSLVLDSIPSSNVFITIMPDEQADLGAGPGVAISRVFTPNNALSPQLIQVLATDDLAVEGEHVSVINHSAFSADLRYDGLAVSNLAVAVQDNDSASVVISEIMYNPRTSESGPPLPEWVEITNIGASSVALDGWRLDDEDTTNWGAIPGGTSLAAGQVAILFDSTFTTAANFRSSWQVPAAALVIGVTWGSLGNSPSSTDEILMLLDAAGVGQDVVNYDDDGTIWPSDATDGASIYLIDLRADNNVGGNWRNSVSGSAGARNAVGAVFSTVDVGSPGDVPGGTASSGLTLDTEDASGVELTRGWATSTSVPGFQGLNYIYAPKGTSAAATFTPTITTAGQYEVFVKYSSHANRASNAAISVIHNGGTFTATQNQKSGGGVFQSIGTFDFTVGNAGKVVVSAAGSNGFVTADAVQFVRVGNSVAAPTATLSSPFIGQSITAAALNSQGFIYVTFASSVAINSTSILDGAAEFTLSGSGAAGVTVNGAAVLQSGSTYRYSFSGSFSPGDVLIDILPGSFADTATVVNVADRESFTVTNGALQIDLDKTDAVQVNTWASSASTAGYVGANYLYNFAGGAGRLVYNPNLPAAGAYQLLVNYTDGATRASNAAYEVVSLSGTSVVRIDQRTLGGTFQSLGIFNFSAGTAGSVTLRAVDADGVVVGDAVRFVRVGDQSGTPTATLAAPQSGATITDITINGLHYIDVTYIDTSAAGLNVSTITDTDPEFTLQGSAAAGVSVTGAATLVSGTTYRYATSGQFIPGVVDVVFAAGTFADQAANLNIETVTDFVVVESVEAEVIVDNTDSGFVLSDPNQFISSSSVSGFVGSNYFAAPTGSTATATWTPTLPRSGVYQVYVRYTSHPLRATNATYQVIHTGGTTTVTIDQTVGGGSWVLLGAFSLTNGTASVRLQSAGANQNVVADAVRFVI